MKKLLNTLFVTSEDAYLILDGENVVVKKAEAIVARFPLHTLQSILSFSYAGASPALMGACAKRDVSLCFCTPSGRFLARSIGESNGNVLLRRTQYRVADNQIQSCLIARNFVFGKVHNARWRLERTMRDHPQRVDCASLENASLLLKNSLQRIRIETSLDSLRGLEGEAASIYFQSLPQLILANNEIFAFKGRNRRPPLDPMNALLSFVYMILANDCASALESVGLDSSVGFLHRDRSGRASLALDLMEELRVPLADSFVLSLVNQRMVNEGDFILRENGAVHICDDARKKILKSWQDRKKEQITHPFLKEKMSWGLVPYLQALLLARHLRGDLSEYPSFLWK